MTAPAVNELAEQSVLGALMLRGEPRHVTALTTRGLKPEHFFWPLHRLIFAAAVSLADHQSAIDPITILAQLDRQGHRGGVTLEKLQELHAFPPAAGHLVEYADEVIEQARWRTRLQRSHAAEQAAASRDKEAWSRAVADLESVTIGTRTESYSPEQWASLLWEHFSTEPDDLAKGAIPLPFERLSNALGGGLRPGEVMIASGATSHGKSVYADMCADVAAKYGKTVHLYMTEMTAIARGMRYLARRTGVPYMRQRRNELSDFDRKKLLDELGKLAYGCTVAADWDVDDIVRDALRARYDLVIVDLLHGFHYEDERGLDRLSKAMQRLARVSTTIDGHPGTAVIAVTHLKEEGIRNGVVPKPTIASIKGGSSIKQDADFVLFVWQDQEENGMPSGDGRIWLAKGRSGELDYVDVRLNRDRFRFDLRVEDAPRALSSAPF